MTRRVLGAGVAAVAAALIGVTAAAGWVLPEPAAAATGPAPSWSRASTSGPSARLGSSIAYDAHTRQLVLFGGADGTSYFGDTWTWNGSTWTKLSPPTSPSPRKFAALVYDPATTQLLLFGGTDATSYFDDTWVWDGSTWAQQSPSASPPVRSAAGVAYDPGAAQLVLFGGTNGLTGLGDTWTWDGSTWTQQSPSASPPARFGAAMAYDTGTGQLVLSGGSDFGPSVFSDTWTWDGSTWTQWDVASPSARFYAPMAYDPATNQMILFGGTSDGSAGLGDTWNWAEFETWSTLSPAPHPSARYGAAMAYDPATSQLLLFGGLDETNYFDDTWVWGYPFGVTGTWTVRSPFGPPARSTRSMAYDPATNQLVLFGGFDGKLALNDTWTWNGTIWSKQSPASSPSPRYGAAMAYDPATSQLLLFGGLDETDYLNDTWSWNGSTWTQLSPAASPPDHDGASMAYDPATGQLVLFGGRGATSIHDGTWTWDGSTWTQLSPASSPSARYGAAMAYDPATGQLVLVGGTVDGSSALGDTWTWDGSTWTQLPSQGLPARYGAAMGYDPATGQLVLFGGTPDGHGSTDLGDTWAWDGLNWMQQAPSAAPPARYGAAMAYDPATTQLVLFGGTSNGSITFGDTWTFIAAATQTTVSVGSSVNPSTVGQQVTYTATVSPDPAGGTVAFSDGGTVLPDCASRPVGAGGTATCRVAYPQVGTHTIVASFAATGGFAASTSRSLTQTVQTAATHTNLSSSVNPSQVGQQVTYTATVSPVPDGGTVAFIDGSTAISGCTAEPVDNRTGKATCQVSYAEPGRHAITATYSGDTDFAPSTSPTLTQTVNPTATGTALTSSANPSVAGQQVTYTATVTPTPNGGTVAFTDGGTTIAGCANQPLDTSTGTATCRISYPQVGTHSIVATYSGYPNYAGSTSPTLTQRVGRVPTTTTVTTSANPTTVGQPVTLTAAVSPDPAGGTVKFTSGGKTLPGCAARPVDAATGKVTCEAVFASAGLHAIVASYSGDANYDGSHSATLRQTVTKVITTTALSSSANPAEVGRPVTLTAAVTPIPDPGTVAFTDNGAAVPGCAAVPVSATTGKATCRLTYTMAGRHTVVASYSGDADSAGSTSAALTLTVDPASTPTAPPSPTQTHTPGNGGLPLTGGPFAALTLLGALLALAGIAVTAATHRRHGRHS